jgi:hypothetical protein
MTSAKRIDSCADADVTARMRVAAAVEYKREFFILIFRAFFKRVMKGSSLRAAQVGRWR